MTSIPGLDIAAHRRLRPYPPRVQLLRVGWALVRPLFRLSPRPAFGLRNLLLRAFGARIGRSVRVYGSAVIYMPWNLELGDYACIGEHAWVYSLGRVSIGARATVSQRAHLCAGTHDDRDPLFALLTPPIAIHDQAWVCADAFIGPGVTIGEGAVIGARAVVVRDVGAWEVVAGNPARVIRRRILRCDCARPDAPPPGSPAPGGMPHEARLR